MSPPLPQFSIIIATRNRPVLLARALASVRAQNGVTSDITVVDDGTDAQHDAALAAIAAGLGGAGRMLHLPRRARGHGPSYALNAGAAAAPGAYLGFLDDDDEWIDDQHLARVARVIDAQATPPDLIFANQIAYENEVAITRPVWIEDLLQRAGRALVRDASGAYTVTPGDLLRSTGFCHVNTTIVRRQFFERIGGFDETILYEGDRDFYLRAIDLADSIRYLPDVVARHHIPSAKARTSMSTMLGDLDKRLFQLRVLDKATLFAGDPAIRRHARRHKAYALKKIALSLRALGRQRAALDVACQALGLGFTVKWLGYTAWLALLSARPEMGHRAKTSEQVQSLNRSGDRDPAPRPSSLHRRSR